MSLQRLHMTVKGGRKMPAHDFEPIQQVVIVTVQRHIGALREAWYSGNYDK